MDSVRFQLVQLEMKPWTAGLSKEQHQLARKPLWLPCSRAPCWHPSCLFCYSLLVTFVRPGAPPSLRGLSRSVTPSRWPDLLSAPSAPIPKWGGRVSGEPQSSAATLRGDQESARPARGRANRRPTAGPKDRGRRNQRRDLPGDCGLR